MALDKKIKQLYHYFLEANCNDYNFEYKTKLS